VTPGDLELIGPTVETELAAARLRRMAWELYLALCELDGSRTVPCPGVEDELQPVATRERPA
jgi:hypothetical protein